MDLFSKPEPEAEQSKKPKIYPVTDCPKTYETLHFEWRRKM